MMRERGAAEGLPSTYIQLAKVHTGPVYVVKFNNTGEYCMTGSEDRSVCLYNPSKNLMIKNYKNIHNYDVYTLDISKDNSKFVSSGGDKNIIVTDVIAGKYIRKFMGHTSRVNSVCFNPENNLIVHQKVYSSAHPTIPLSDAGTAEAMLITLSKSSRDSKTQSHKL